MKITVNSPQRQSHSVLVSSKYKKIWWSDSKPTSCRLKAGKQTVSLSGLEDYFQVVKGKVMRRREGRHVKRSPSWLLMCLSSASFCYSWATSSLPAEPNTSAISRLLLPLSEAVFMTRQTDVISKGVSPSDTCCHHFNMPTYFNLLSHFGLPFFFFF